MIVFTSGKVQDTLHVSQTPSKNIAGKAGDAFQDKVTGKTAVILPGNDAAGRYSAEEDSLCRRTDTGSISFHDKNSFLRSLTVPGGDKSVIELASEAKEIKARNHQVLLTRLKEGESPPAGSMDNDLILMILLGAVLLLAVVRSSVKNFQPVRRFFLFRGISDPVSADTGVIFHWQTTLLNLLSFFAISLYAYRISALQGIIPPGWGGFVFWLACLGIIMGALTFRHIICVITGNLSGKTEVFNEYLIGIYQSYHFAAILLLILVLLASFTVLLPAKIFIAAGICCISLMYLIRITRLLLIFINRNISVFYLILYLCALEILPVAVIIRYFSAL